MGKIIIKVWRQHEAIPGMEAYASPAFAAEFSLDGNPDDARLVASHMVEYLAAAYAGDPISLYVEVPRRAHVEQFCFAGKADGKNQHEEGDGSFTWEETIVRIARAI
ncbi:hypothetical protein SAMN03159338_1492 [Sphingomonas sp. NFR04]|uniref:hypothetical protein n=1 Tax=Sphingomonas sp. NFR04 TaxID=1566283 RepID=UPI0008EE898C|nr:hypothetical protein [Sphingomonas sp. NFR04]SFJ47452.1 hypothetical protein SAMN03159338_1492 [Sphingomonas sp. NFR04]